ncbi:MAG: DUF86 domain-containing protein [bacterium]
MVIANLNTTLIRDRLQVIIEALNRLEELSKLSLEEYLADYRNPRTTESYLRHVLEAMFDLGRHILAKTAAKKFIEYKEIARQLGKNKVISQGLAERLIPIAGYRNRIVHYYHEITDEELYGIIQHDLGDIWEFVRGIDAFLQRYSAKEEKL